MQGVRESVQPRSCGSQPREKLGRKNAVAAEVAAQRLLTLKVHRNAVGVTVRMWCYVFHARMGTVGLGGVG